MMNKRMALIMVLIFGLGMVFASCATIPTAANFKDPVITLESVEVPHYDGYWYYSSGIKPTKGKAGNHGAPLILAVTLNIHNPNPYPVLLDGYRFTIAFDDCDVITHNAYETQWIPAGETNQLRSTTMLTTRSVLLGVGAVSGRKIEAMGLNIWQAMEKWWTTIEDMAFPIKVYDSALNFRANGVSKILGFEGTYPKK